MYPLVFALSVIFPLVKAAVATSPLTVHTHSVIQFLESSGTTIDWVPVGDNVSLTTFPNEDWASWESELLNVNDSITVPNISPPYDKRIESLDYRYSCYRSGSWAKDSVLEAHIDHACETFKHGLNVGTTQLLKYPKMRNVAGDEMVVYMRYTPYDSGRGAKLSCKSLLSTLINKQCQGAHKDTRGGGIWWYRGKYVVDPTTLNCNC